MQSILSLLRFFFQGKSYWVRFVMTFRSFTVNHGIVKDFPGKPEKYDMFVDQAFIYVHEQFVEGTCKKNQLSKQLGNIVMK